MAASLPDGMVGTQAESELRKFTVLKLSRHNSSTSTNEKSLRFPTEHVTNPELNQPKLEVHSNSTKPVAKTETKSSSAFNNTAQCNSISKPSDSNVKPWPYGIPPCSRYEIKLGNPAYTGFYVDGEWWYDIVGAVPEPRKWPDTSDMFPDIPNGIFELRSVECNDGTLEKSAAFEGLSEDLKCNHSRQY